MLQYPVMVECHVDCYSVDEDLSEIFWPQIHLVVIVNLQCVNVLANVCIGPIGSGYCAKALTQEL